MTNRSALPSVAPRYDSVDLLRGLAIVAVVLLHINLRFFFAHISLGPSLPPRLRYLLLFNGDNGVTVFFAVSGFLITTTSLRRFGSLSTMRPRLFYRIRFARIAPLLLGVLAMLSALHLLHATGFRLRNTSLPHALFAALTFHLNWLEARVGYLEANWDVLWSLSVEEMFYLFFPLVCLALLRWRRGLLLFVLFLCAFVIMGPFARVVWTHNEIWQEKTYLGGMDAIALGCLTALLAAHLEHHRFATARIGARVLLGLQLAGSGLIFLIAYWPHWHWLRRLGDSGLDGTILPLGACCVMLATVLRGTGGRAWTAPLRWFGRHSYEVYLTHEFLVVWGTLLLVRVGHGAPWLWCLGIFALTAPLGWLVSRFFSEPMNRWLRGAPLPQQLIPRQP